MISFKVTECNIQNIKYWINTITSIVKKWPKPSIILVGTHKEEYEKKQLEELKNKINNEKGIKGKIQKVVFISNTKNKGFKNLRTVICDVSRNSNLSSQKVPMFYISATAILDNLKRSSPILSFDEYYKLFSIHVTEPIDINLELLTTFWHEVFFFFLFFFTIFFFYKIY